MKTLNKDIKQTNQMNDAERVAVGDHVIIYRRGKRGIYTADFHFNDENGLRQHGRESLRTRNRRVAESKAAELDRRLTAGEVVGSPRRKAPIGIDIAIEQFIEAKRLDGRTHKTIVKYEAELRNFAAHLQATLSIVAIDQLKPDHVDQYRKHRREVDLLDSYTIYNHVIILKTWLKWCRCRRLIATNPLEEYEIAEPRRRRHPAATFEQISAILASSTGWMFAVLAVLAFTGLRVGELIALRPEDVDLKAGVIHVRRREDWAPKTASSERDVPLHRRLLAILSAKSKGRGGWFLNPPASRQFPGGDHHLNPRDVNVHFQAIAKKAGFAVGRKDQGLTLHSLRRFFKTISLDGSVPKPMVDAWMGHQDQSGMDHFYYNSTKSKEWIERVAFGEPNDTDVNCLKGANNASCKKEQC